MIGRRRDLGGKATVFTQHQDEELEIGKPSQGLDRQIEPSVLASDARSRVAVGTGPARAEARQTDCQRPTAVFAPAEFIGSSSRNVVPMPPGRVPPLRPFPHPIRFPPNSIPRSRLSALVLREASVWVCPAPVRPDLT